LQWDALSAYLRLRYSFRYSFPSKASIRLRFSDVALGIRCGKACGDIAGVY